MFRVALARSTRTLTVSQPSRMLHSTPQALKTVTEKAKEVASNRLTFPPNKVNLKVGQGLASAIETGEQATQSAKETLGQKTEEASEATQKAADIAKQKGNQAAAGATEAKEDFKKELRK
ncbi:hypothetical protein FRC17_003362 [Serendipita sp. 399]|nr:hypothetical protein FRC17_003362 [Serendipita sp. 399]